MLEVELNSVVDDIANRRRAIEAEGATLDFEGRLLDVRYDFEDRSMMLRDHVLRLRIYETKSTRTGSLDWKGETRYDGGFKQREELTTSTDNPEVLAEILERLGFIVTTVIDRQIAQYNLNGATVRFEEYPEMDPLVEVEGSPEQIESAIAAIGLSRAGFTSERLLEFVSRYEARTGKQESPSLTDSRLSTSSVVVSFPELLAD
jgi:adenylate cyclase class IV